MYCTQAWPSGQRTAWPSQPSWHWNVVVSQCFASGQSASARHPARQASVDASQMFPVVHAWSSRQPARHEPLTQIRPELQRESLVPQPAMHVADEVLHTCSFGH